VIQLCIYRLFACDDVKNRISQHGVSFESAARVFEDQQATSWVERVVNGEERWHTIGLAGGILLLLVAHTVEVEDGEEKIRIISARKAVPRERAIYDPLD
jgi:uncharacterized DUF497 family protein